MTVLTKDFLHLSVAEIKRLAADVHFVVDDGEKAVDWDPRKHPRGRHGQFARTPGISPEVQRVLDAVESLKADQRSEPAKLETVGSLVADAINARADVQVQALQTQRHELESQWSDLGEEHWQISKQLDAFLVGEKHGRTELTSTERQARDDFLRRDDEITARQIALGEQIVRLGIQEHRVHRQATVGVLGEIRPMGGEFRTAETKFHAEDGLAPQSAYDAHDAALADIQHLMPTAWVEQMNLQGSVHWDLWKRCRGWQRELPNSTDRPVSIQRRDFPSDEEWKAEVTRRAQAAGVRPQDITYSGEGSLTGVETRFAYWLPGSDSEVKAMAGDAGVYLHELLHRVQLLNPSGPLHDAQVRYLNERTGAPSSGWDKQIRPLRSIYPGAGYEEPERAIEDNFVSAYYGKLYGPGYGTTYNELLTMSMQDLFFNNNRLRVGDPRTYQWILGTLAVL